MATGILILFCVAILNFGISNGKTPTLKHVIVTYRSGEHTPCDFAGGPKITNVSESESTLTTPGVDRAYKLGQTLGNKYKTQLQITSKWTHNDYYSMGTPAPRCQMSAMNFGAGLEENEGGKVTKWESEQQEKAKEGNVTFPHSDQYLRFLNMTKCPGFYSELKKKLPTWIPELKSNYSTKLKEVTAKYSSINDSIPYTVWLGYEIFQTQNETNHTAMTWLSQDNWEGLSGYSEDYIFDVESEENLKKLTGGIMVDSIFNVTETIINGSNPQGRVKGQKSSHKMSALGVSQAPLAAMLGAFTPSGTTYKDKPFDAKNFYPRNGAHHVVEIYQEGQGKKKSDFKIKVLYAPGGGKDELSPLKYPECGGGDMCPFDKLEKVLEKTRLPGGEQEKLCKPQTPK